MIEPVNPLATRIREASIALLVLLGGFSSIIGPKPASGQIAEAQFGVVEIEAVGDRSFGVVDRAFGGGVFATALFDVSERLRFGVEWHRTHPTRGFDPVCVGLIDPTQCLPENVETNSSYLGLRLGWEVDRDVSRRMSIGLRPALGVGSANVTERGLESGKEISETDLSLLGGVDGILTLRPFNSSPSLRLLVGPDLIVPISIACDDCGNYVEDQWVRLRLGVAVRF